MAGLFLLCGCATVPFQPAGTLSSYNALEPSDGFLTHARIAINKDAVLAVSTVQILPATFTGEAADVALSPMQRDILTNAVDRSLCIGLSERFHLTGPGETAQLRVHAVIIYIGLTDAAAAAVSRVASVGASVVQKVFLPSPVSVPVPRLPVGMGGLGMEAEALGPNSQQFAAMIWARGANAFTGQPKVSVEGDAYDLGKTFGDDFSRLLVTGESPFKKLPRLPSVNAINSMLGAAPKEVACDAFGRGPGVVGLVGDAVGLPPEWTDKPKARSEPASPPTSLPTSLPAGQ